MLLVFKIVFRNLKGCLRFFPSWIPVSTGITSFLRNLSPQVVSGEQESRDFTIGHRVHYDPQRSQKWFKILPIISPFSKGGLRGIFRKGNYSENLLLPLFAKEGMNL